MFSLLFSHELRSILFGPRFLVVASVTVILIGAGVTLGIREYEHDLRGFERAVELNKQQLIAQDHWSTTGWAKAYRAPTPLSVFVSGLGNDVGRTVPIMAFGSAKLANPKYAEEPLFALFRPLDFAFIVQFVLSLLAIVLSFDLICGEKERGTLRLVLSNPIPRTKFVLAKFMATWLGLMVPLFLAFLVGLLVVNLFGPDLSLADWINVVALFWVSVLYLTVFVALGLFVSTLVARPANAFMILLVMWAFFVLVVPRVATLAAGEFVEVATVSEVGSATRTYRRNQQNEMTRRRNALTDRHVAETMSLSREEAEVYMRENRARWNEEQKAFDRFRDRKNQDFSEFQRKLNEQVSAQKSQLQKTALSFSRFSPAASYRIVSMRLSGTDIGLKGRYEDVVREFEAVYRAFIDEKMAPWREGTGTVEPFDVTQLPRFKQPRTLNSEVIRSVLFDAGLLSLYALMAFAAAYVSFLRYDVR